MDSSMVNAVANCGPSSSSGMPDKSKEWHNEMLMEKLRCKSGQLKSLVESSKALRMSLLEKRYPGDSMERNLLYKCLDTIQQNIKVTSLQAMVERLESVSRQLGLKFMAGPSGLDWFISSDMFYLEVVFESNETVKDVKIHHEGNGERDQQLQSCKELVSCLNRRDFADFAAQLEGLASIYQLNAEKKVKIKAFSALQSLETDLTTLSTLQSVIKEPYNLVHKSPVGVLQKRRGGHPMKLTYFISPFDLLDPVNKVSKPLTVDNLEVGNSVTVCIEGSQSHKLQTSTLIAVNSNGKNLVPSYGPLTNQNSANLPACFVLKLNRPMPMCVQLVRKIEQVTEIQVGDCSGSVPLMSLIVQHTNSSGDDVPSLADVESVENKGLFVILPDQIHCYFMTENHNLDAIVVNSIQFTHPAHVPQILVYLRQQALLNTVIASCVRQNNSKNVDLEKVIMMEVTPLSYQQVSISLEHPIEESMATAELDLTDITNVQCKLYNASQAVQSNDYVTKVLQRSLSIPITMRALIRSWLHEPSHSHGLNTNGGNLFGSGPGGNGNSGGPGNGNNSGPGGGNGNLGPQLSGPETDINIKPDPDMMQVDCDSNTVMSECNIDTLGAQPGSSLSITSADFNQIVKSVEMNQSPNNSSDCSIFNLLTDEKPINIDDISLVGNSPPVLDITDVLIADIATENMNLDVKNPSDEVIEVKKEEADFIEIKSESPEIVESENSSNPRKRKWNQIEDDEENDCEIIMETSCSNESNISSSTTNNNSNNSNKSFEKFKSNSREDSQRSNSPMVIIEVLGKKSSASNSPNVSSTSSLHSPSSILKDLESKNLPSVSITPIPASAINPVVSIERRTNMEIIPLTTVSNSITITSITTSKSSSSRSKSKSNDEKDRKRKRRKEESGMGPPNKQDPLLKQVSVNIKPADCVSPSSPNTIRTKSSTKHSQSPIYSSPKSSPKQVGTSSPGSGKPSMSALKSAVSSPKSEKSKSSGSKDSSSSKDKDRKSSGHSSPKLKSSSVKLKQLDLNSDMNAVHSNQSDCLTPPPGLTGDGKSQPQAKTRKGLSAVIDQLKSRKTPESSGSQDIDGKTVSQSSGNNGNKERNMMTVKSSDKSSPGSKPTDNKVPGEYMVKHSSDGMKITINKTRSKDSSKSINKQSLGVTTSGSGSPKTHTGLKPGVNSGPASKKPQQSKSSSTNMGNKLGSKSKISSPGKNLKSSGTSKDLKKSSKSIFSKSDNKKMSPSAHRDKDDNILSAILPAQLVVGALAKPLDPNFQIPKLSARANSSNNSGNSDKRNDNGKNTVSSSSEKSLSTMEDGVADSTKSNNLNLNDSGIGKKSETLIDSFSDNLNLNNNNTINISSSIPSVTSGSVLNITSSSSNLGNVMSTAKSVMMNSFLDQSASIDLTGTTTPQEAAEILLDISTTLPMSSMGILPLAKNTPPPPPPPPPPLSSPTLTPSPQFQVHILNTTASSPLIIPSPHPASPCITDDELMDEALVGIGK